MKWFFILLCLQGLNLFAGQRPNILLIMVDDLGFSDFGCYGSEIRTPRIDSLAEHGLRFTQFYNTAKCESSRVSLLTGLYSNQAGGAKLSRATTIAEVLKEAGYFTSMAGKWHLAKEPTDFGFSRYWGHLSGATDFFIGDKSFRLNGQNWDDFDEDFYTTDANVDWSIKFIEEAAASGKPFFHYIAFNAPHYPLQAPREDIEKYIGQYDDGWEKIRSARFSRQKELGIFPRDMELPAMPEHITPWNSLSGKEREFESFRMAVYAAMVDRLDSNIGRVMDYLENTGLMENTLVILCSDNGACPFERSSRIDIPAWKGRSHLTYDANWATIGNTPLRHYKQTQHEGGISSPLIVHWPNHIKNVGGWERNPGHLIDIMATCIEVGDAAYPESNTLEPLQGKSLVPLFNGRERVGHEEIYFRFSSCRALRKGDWKVVSFYGQRWELYNIAEDRTEQTDLADTYPDRVKELSERWHAIAVTKDHLDAKESKPVRDEPSSHNKSIWHKPGTFRQWKRPW